MNMQHIERAAAMQINPLIGASHNDTMQNLYSYLDSVACCMADSHADPALAFFMQSIASTLRYEMLLI